MSLINPLVGVARYDADEYYRKALQAFSKNNLEAAILNMDQAIALVPRHSEYLAARGLMYLEHGEKEKALADFDAARRIHPFEMLANYGRGIIAYRDKNWDEALAHFTDAWAAKPERPETQYYLALVNHRKGDQRTALIWMQQAYAAFEKANDRKRANDAARWVREFQKLIERNP